MILPRNLCKKRESWLLNSENFPVLSEIFSSMSSFQICFLKYSLTLEQTDLA